VNLGYKHGQANRPIEADHGQLRPLTITDVAFRLSMHRRTCQNRLAVVGGEAGVAAATWATLVATGSPLRLRAPPESLSGQPRLEKAHRKRSAAEATLADSTA